MNRHYAYTPEIWPSVLTVLLLITLSVYAWRRGSVPGARVFAISCLVVAPWAVGFVMELAAEDLATKILWFKFQGVWKLPTVTAMTCFILEYAWPGRWLTRRNLALLSAPCLLTLLLILTNNLHHLVWRGFAYDGMVIALRGPGFWSVSAYGYALSIVNLVLFAWLFVRSPQHRWPVTIMFVGQVLGRGLYLLDIVHVLRPGAPFDLPPAAFEYLLYAIALFGFHILDPIPLARQAVFAQMQEGVLVLDTQGRVASLNPAAERILGTSARQVKGKPARGLLTAYPDGQPAVPSESEIELSLPEGPGLRHYTLAISLLYDFRGLDAGRLLLLRDVTEQKRIQAQVMEQQKVVAVLHEREQLARELHDSLGQVLGYISLQAQAIRKRARDEGVDSIEFQLSRLAEVAQEAHKDVRESIFNLKTGPAEGWSFFITLRSQLAAYQAHYGIHAELALPEGLTEDLFETGVTLQLLRVIQEALTNIRKHGRASHVQVSFACEDSQVQIVVADDGRGFDPDEMKEDGESHFGLAFMRERMEQIGGSLAIEARSGAGTRVLLCLPISETRKEAAA